MEGVAWTHCCGHQAQGWQIPWECPFSPGAPSGPPHSHIGNWWEFYTGIAKVYRFPLLRGDRWKMKREARQKVRGLCVSFHSFYHPGGRFQPLRPAPRELHTPYTTDSWGVLLLGPSSASYLLLSSSDTPSYTAQR